MFMHLLCGTETLTGRVDLNGLLYSIASCSVYHAQWANRTKGRKKKKFRCDIGSVESTKHFVDFPLFRDDRIIAKMADWTGSASFGHASTISASSAGNGFPSGRTEGVSESLLDITG
jgi:hypothetical protein